MLQEKWAPRDLPIITSESERMSIPPDSIYMQAEEKRRNELFYSDEVRAQFGDRLRAFLRLSLSEREEVAREGLCLRQRRWDRGLSIDDAAQELMVSPVEIYFIETGAPPPGGINPELVGRLNMFCSNIEYI